MAIALVQHGFNNPQATQSTVTFTYASAQTAGNLNIVCIGWANVAGTVSSIVDTKLNPYTLAVNTQMGGTPQTQSIYYSAGIQSAGAGANTVTITFSGAVPFPDIRCSEFSGIATSSPLTGTPIGTGATTASPNSGNVTTVDANALLFGGFLTAFSFTGQGTGYTLLDLDTNGSLHEYQIVSSTGTYSATATISLSSDCISQLAAFKAATGTTPVNATVSIAARATLTLPVTVQKDATVVFASRATIQARSDFGVFATFIGIGRATSSSFKSLLTHQETANIGPRATVTPAPRVTHNATVQIAAHANLTAAIQPTIVNATVHLFGFAANNTPILQVFGRAVARFTPAQFGPNLTFRGTATFNPTARLTHNSSVSIAGHAALAPNPKVTGPGQLNATVLIAGRVSALVASVFLTHNATVHILAGNGAGLIPALGTAQIRGRASLTLTSALTHNAVVNIAGRATNLFNALVTGGSPTNINAAVFIAGHASLRASVPVVPVPATAGLAGRATLAAQGNVVVSLNQSVVIRGRASGFFLGVSVGSTNLNAVTFIAGRGTLASSVRLTSGVAVFINSRSSLVASAFRNIRNTISIQGFCRLTAATPRQPISWISNNTIQYKVWQFNVENTTRVFGTSFSVQSIGMSFQSVSLEVIMTEAGWGS